MGHTIVDRFSWGILLRGGSHGAYYRGQTDGAYYSGQALMGHTIDRL